MSVGRLKIIINDRPLRLRRTGVGHYIEQLLRWLPRAAPQHEYKGFLTHVLGRGPAGKIAGDEGPDGSGDRRPPVWVRRVLECGYNAAFRAGARGRRSDVYHEPNHIAVRCGLPTVTTIHDLSVLRHPEWHPPDRVAWYERHFRSSVQATHGFVCPSEFTKHELVEIAGVDADRVTVIAEAPRETFRPQSAEAVAAWRARVGLPNPFFLFVGTFEPRKNIDAVLTAYSRLSIAIRNRCPLVLAGPRGWGMTPLVERTSKLGIEGTVVPLGYVSDGDLALVYTAARALVWPSWYEGFGLPPLECMACGTPVITSGTTSLPEVVGDAALLVEPADIDALTRAMERLAEDGALVSALAEKGRQRAGEFTWERCAREHVVVYETCAAELR